MCVWHVSSVSEVLSAIACRVISDYPVLINRSHHKPFNNNRNKKKKTIDLTWISHLVKCNGEPRTEHQQSNTEIHTDCLLLETRATVPQWPRPQETATNLLLLCAKPNCQKTNQTQKAVSKYVIKIWLVQFAIYCNSISFAAERIPSHLCIFVSSILSVEQTVAYISVTTFLAVKLFVKLKEKSS